MEYSTRPVATHSQYSSGAARTATIHQSRGRANTRSTRRAKIESDRICVCDRPSNVGTGRPPVGRCRPGRRSVRIRRAIVRNVDKEPKTASGRRSVELDAIAQACLHRQADFTLGKSLWVFHDPRTDQRWRGDGAIRKKVWTPALAAAAVTYRNPYQTRHTFASTHLTAGKNPMWVAHQLGHRDWGMNRRVYGRWLPA